MNKLLLIKIPILIYVVAVVMILSVVPDNFQIASLMIISSLIIIYLVIIAGKHLSDKLDKKTEFLHKEILADYSQIESLFAIYNLLKIDSILPPFRGWAISPDFASVILKKIRHNKLEMIIECGSGVSTLIIAYLLKQRGSGHLYTLEHDKVYAEKTRQQLLRNDLTDYVTIIEKEMSNYKLNNKEWLWYNISDLDEDLKVDLLIVDGPPFQIQPKSRYPAIPLLNKYLKNQAIVLIDDCNREDDKSVVEQWTREFSYYAKEWIDTEKGAFLLTKHNSG